MNPEHPQHFFLLASALPPVFVSLPSRVSACGVFGFGKIFRWRQKIVSTDLPLSTVRVGGSGGCYPPPQAISEIISEPGFLPVSLVAGPVGFSFGGGLLYLSLLFPGGEGVMCNGQFACFLNTNLKSFVC